MSPSPSTERREVGIAPASPLSPALRDPLSAALTYASRGWPVFPVAGVVGGHCSCGRGTCDNAAKHPLTHHGLHDASTDPARIGEWWRHWPEANVAISTGPARLVVIDIDPANGGWESLSRLYDAGYRWGNTAVVVSGGGGVHFYLRAGDPLRNRSGSLPGVPFPLPGIDLRADGGYVVAPPSAHVSGGRYRWLEADVVMAAVPTWLRQPPRANRQPAPPPASTGDCSRYGMAALAGEITSVRMAAVGTRNHELNRAAFALGQLVGAGHLALATTREALIEAALAAGLPEREAERTVSSGLDAGMDVPRTTASHDRR